MKVYMIGTSYLESTLSTFPYLIALIAFSLAVLDGPNIVERLFGIDAGLKSGWGMIAGAYAGSKVVSGGMKAMTKGADFASGGKISDVKSSMNKFGNRNRNGNNNNEKNTPNKPPSPNDNDGAENNKNKGIGNGKGGTKGKQKKAEKNLPSPNDSEESNESDDKEGTAKGSEDKKGNKGNITAPYPNDKKNTSVGDTNQGQQGPHVKNAKGKQKPVAQIDSDIDNAVEEIVGQGNPHDTNTDGERKPINIKPTSQGDTSIESGGANERQKSKAQQTSTAQQDIDVDHVQGSTNTIETETNTGISHTETRKRPKEYKIPQVNRIKNIENDKLIQ